MSAEIRGQFEYLANFASQLADWLQPADGRFLVRCAMYASSAHGTYEEGRRRRETGAGMSEERRVTTALESCEECLAAEARGWRPIGSLPRIGTLACPTNCRCWFEYR